MAVIFVLANAYELLSDSSQIFYIWQLIDDIFLIWPHGLTALQQIIDHLNTVHPTIYNLYNISSILQTYFFFLFLLIDLKFYIHVYLYAMPIL